MSRLQGDWKVGTGRDRHDGKGESMMQSSGTQTNRRTAGSLLYPPSHSIRTKRQSPPADSHHYEGNNRNYRNDNLGRNAGEVYYTPATSPIKQTTSGDSKGSSYWFPMSIPSFGSMMSQPSDENPRTSASAGSLEKPSSSRDMPGIGAAAAAATAENTRQQYSARTLSTSPTMQQSNPSNLTNPFSSRSSSASPPSRNNLRTTRGHPKISKLAFASSSSSSPPPPPNQLASSKSQEKVPFHPFGSLSNSCSDSPTISANNTRSYSRSPSPVYQRPSRKINTKQSDFHTLLSCAASPDDAQFLDALELLTTSKNPRKLAQLKLSDAHDWTALHIASLSNPPLYLIYALLIVFPEGVRERDSAGRLPLHLAAGNETRASVLNVLVRFYNEGISLRDDRGFIPLHLAFLRDGNEEISIEAVRILLGQNIGNGDDAQIRWGGNQSPRPKRDGYMRNKGHLNLRNADIHKGLLGESRNSAILRERKRREEISRFTRKDAGVSLSRGFARNINEVDSQDGEPYNHEHLASLWLEDNQNLNDPFHLLEISETKLFSPDIQNCLKQLTQWKKKYDKEHKSSESEHKPSEKIENPATIVAPPHLRLPIHMAVRRNHKRNSAAEVMHTTSTLDIPSNQNEILRVLIHAFPSSLMVKDLQNKTPLMTCLSMIHHKAIHPVDLDMVNLLLGTQSFGFDYAPRWLEDDLFFREHQNIISHESEITQHKIGGIIRNAAMVPCDETFPLHIAARECLSTEIVHAIYACYPGAKYAQDDRGCTPLHCTLQNLTGKNIVNLDVLRVLMDEKVLKIQNYMDQSLYDLLVANARAKKLPKTCKKQSTHIFKPFFDQAVTERSINISGSYHKNSIFTDLSAFPSWVRKQACATPSFQDLLLAETSGAFNTALIFLYGISLLTLVISFTSMTEDLISQRTAAEVHFSISQKIVVLVTNLYLSIQGLLYTFTTIRLNIYVKESLSNIWSWINFISLLSSFIVTVQIWYLEQSPANISVKATITLSTIAIGTLWSSCVGYLSKWWYGISCFCSGAIKIASCLISPLIVMCVISLAFMQMVYLIHMRDGQNNGQCLYEDQSDVNGESLAVVCSLWESYKIAYLLIIGEGLLGTDVSSGNSALALVLVFAIVAFILILYTVSLSILNIQQSGIEATMVDTFWLPMLTHVLVTQRLKEFFSVRRNFPTISSRLRDMWDYIMISSSDVDVKETKWWYLQNDPKMSRFIGKKWFVRMVSVFIIPMWFVIGLLSLGILWPPQIRHWIFHIGMKDNDNSVKMDESWDHSNYSQMASLHSDISKMKLMMYDRFQIMEDEIRALKRSVNNRMDKE